MILQDLNAPSHNLVFTKVWANVTELYCIKTCFQPQKDEPLAEELQEYAAEVKNIRRGFIKLLSSPLVSPLSYQLRIGFLLYNGL